MKALFVHDHIFREKNNQFYSSGAFPRSIWPRYTSVFEKVTVIGRDGGKLTDFDKGFTLSSVKNVEFRLLHNISDIRSFIFGNAGVEQACKQLVANHDALIVRLPSRMGVLFIREARKQKKPYAIEVVGCPWDALWNYGNLKGKIFAPYATLELKRISSQAGHVLYVTECFLQTRYPAAKDAATTFCSNVEIPTVFDDVLEKRLILIDQMPFRKVVKFGLIGNYSSKYKGIDIAIKALAEAKLPNWQLQVLGNGNPDFYITLAKELGVSDNVFFIGSVPSGQPVFDWLDTIDIYLQPSFQEGLPRALVEAMSRGCPVLASNIAGIPELLDEAEMIKVGEFSELAKKIIKLSADLDRQKVYSEKNFNKAKNYYKNILDARRLEFWKNFKNKIK